MIFILFEEIIAFIVLLPKYEGVEMNLIVT